MADPGRSLSGSVSMLDRVTLQLGVAVAVIIATCSYAVSATSLYALGVQAGYSRWQAAAVPVVADGPAIYGMFRIVSRSRRGAKGAGYGWLLVICGTAASIGGNVAHARSDLVAQAIAAAIPLAVLAMLEGLKGDADEAARLTAGSVPVAVPDGQPDAPDLGAQTSSDTLVRRLDTPDGLGADRDTARLRPWPPHLHRRRPGSRGGCGPSTPRAGPAGGRGRPGRWPRRPIVATAAPPPTCAATATRLRKGERHEAAPARPPHPGHPHQAPHEGPRGRVGQRPQAVG
jgi:hypothetical protein